MILSRRRFAAAALSALYLPRLVRAATPAPGLRVILLGTKGGPTPSPYRAAPATLILFGGRAYLVDCGNGTAGQLAKAGTRLSDLAGIFVTHNHSDHVIDVGSLLVLAWDGGLDHPIHVYGPPPLRRIVDRGIDAAAYDIAARRREEGRGPIAPLIRVHEKSDAGTVVAADGLRVTCALVDHYTVKPAFAYRFDAPGRSVVVSGDTAYSENLIALARGADLLIHEAIYLPALDQLADKDAPRLRDHLLRSHSTPEEAGRVAARAGVRKLVLSHLVPAAPSVTDEMWLREVRKSYTGEAVVGHDLMEV
jgi:ribonuclease BN (tRNA processing enzyme)